jgi:hypothetical protein
MVEPIEQDGKTSEVLPMELPEFYHEKISYKMASDFMRVNRRMSKVNLLIATRAKDDATPEEQLQVSIAQSEALDEADELVEKLQDFLNFAIKSIPRSWLIEGAPKDIEDGQWLNWVRRDRFADVGDAYQTAGTRDREDAKN